jgi:hypothetical protein
VAQVVKGLPSNQEALSSIPTTAKKKKNSRLDKSKGERWGGILLEGRFPGRPSKAGDPPPQMNEHPQSREDSEANLGGGSRES